ncbi:MAG: glycosyltransferase family 1 protein, partial [Coriobacteriia bacterium]|nr:glycosyltransferase family 1 protein [Coriobacteriia bacterium]
VDYVHYVFPNMPVYRMRWSIDNSLFSLVGSSRKKRQICFMPRRRPEEATQVFNILRFRGALDGFKVIPIHDMNAQETAGVMGGSMLFFSFGYPEGLPLPPAEAMSRGCVVVGYHGWGGREYFDPSVCFPVEAGDVMELARTAERVLDACRANDASVLGRGRLASKLIRSKYSRQQETDDVTSAWSELLSGRTDT